MPRFIPFNASSLATEYTPSEQKRKKDDDRSKIALHLVSAFIVLNALVIILFPLYNLFIEPKLDIVETVIKFNGVFGPIIGFVVGHYFKNDK